MCDTQADVAPRPQLRAQLAFKDSMVHGILQFTPSIAFRYVLHRCESRDIRCRESFYAVSVITHPARAPSPVPSSMYFMRIGELLHETNCLEQGLALQTWVLRGFSLVKWVFMVYLGVLPVECVFLCDFPRVTMYFMRIGELLHETNCLEQGLALQTWVLRGF